MRRREYTMRKLEYQPPVDDIDWDYDLDISLLMCSTEVKQVPIVCHQ